MGRKTIQLNIGISTDGGFEEVKAELLLDNGEVSFTTTDIEDLENAELTLRFPRGNFFIDAMDEEIRVEEEDGKYTISEDDLDTIKDAFSLQVGFTVDTCDDPMELLLSDKDAYYKLVEECWNKNHIGEIDLRYMGLTFSSEDMPEGTVTIIAEFRDFDITFD